MTSPDRSSRAMADLATALLRAQDANEYLGAIMGFLPAVVPADHFNLLVTHPDSTIYARKLSPGFPEQIFDDYARLGAPADLILQRGKRLQAGAIVHFGSVRHAPDAPPGWDHLVKVTTAAGCVDTITVVLLVNEKEGWGAALTLWRFHESKPFSKEEARTVESMGPMLAAAFNAVWTNMLLRASNELTSTLAATSGYFSFLAREDGIPVHVDPGFSSGLRAICGKTSKGQLPAAIRKAARQLLADPRNKPVGSRSVEVVIRNHRCRVFATDAPVEPVEAGLYRIFLMCTPIYMDMKPLLKFGFLPNEVAVLELLQRGKNVQEIRKTLSLKLLTTKYYLRALRKKLQARGKAETVAKAIALCREINILRALLGSHAKLPIKDTRGAKGRPPANRPAQ